MKQEQNNLDETVDEAKTDGTIDLEADIDEQVRYMEERNAEKAQIESFRSICKAIVAILFVFALIGGIFLLQIHEMLGVSVIAGSVLLTVLIEKLIDIICNLFVDVKAIRIQLWESNHK